MNINSKLLLGSALLLPSIASAAPADDVAQLTGTATTVFGAAAAVGITIIGYRIVKRILARHVGG